MADNFSRYSEIRKILSTISNQSCEEIGLNSDLFAAGILDSFGIIEFVFTLEKHFHCIISQEDLIPQNFWSVQAISDTLVRLGVTSST
jgi:acyl carrier protein